MPKSKMLEDVYPQYAKVAWRYSRWHHYVDYTPFKKNYPSRNLEIGITKGVNNYGMKLVEDYPTYKENKRG